MKRKKAPNQYKTISSFSAMKTLEFITKQFIRNERKKKQITGGNANQNSQCAFVEIEWSLGITACAMQCTHILCVCIFEQPNHFTGNIKCMHNNTLNVKNRCFE